MLTTTGSPAATRPLAWRTSARWPSCRLPIVGTKAARCAPPVAARSSAIVWTTFISGSVGVQRLVGERAVLHGRHVAVHRVLDRRGAFHEVAHEARQLA